jgi:BASS family bile acid:Na+ symporter
MGLRKMSPNIGATIELLGGFLGIMVILFLVVTWIPRNHQLLASTPFAVYFAAIGLGLMGMALGYALSRLLRQDAKRSRTIALETGIQNGPLAVLIVTLSFAGTMQQDILLIPVLYSLFIVISSSFVTVAFRRRSDREALARDKAKAGQLASS